MMHTRLICVVFLFLAGSGRAAAQSEPAAGEGSFGRAAESARQQLEASLQELAELRARIADETIPLNRTLNDLETELIDVRLEFQQTTRLLDKRTLDLSNLRAEIKTREEEAAYLSNLLGEYVRSFESRLHIAELHRYENVLEAAMLAPENSGLSQQEIYLAQTRLLSASLERLHEALGGSRFEGSAVDDSGLVRPGTFVVLGPAAVFESVDGSSVGTAEQRLGSLEPAVIGFQSPDDAAAAGEALAAGWGAAARFPLDPTLGNAHKIEATQETLWEHIRKGGPVMVPIFALAAAALLIALFKWIGLMFVRNPSQKRLRALLRAIAQNDRDEVKRRAVAISGPTGRMLRAGVEHLDEPRDLIEEVMYETVLATRLRTQRFLPFIAICAASAPLLGLLGTVTGIINTFKLITVFGTGDVKSLSGGISEALITTEFGLIVAIPSLLLHAFLSRKARGVVDQMERSAIAFVNQVARSSFGRGATSQAPPAEVRGDANVLLEQPHLVGRTTYIHESKASPPRSVQSQALQDQSPTSDASAHEATRRQVRDILLELLDPMVKASLREQQSPPPASSSSLPPPSPSSPARHEASRPHHDAVAARAERLVVAKQ